MIDWLDFDTVSSLFCRSTARDFDLVRWLDGVTAVNKRTHFGWPGFLRFVWHCARVRVITLRIREFVRWDATFHSLPELCRLVKIGVLAVALRLLD